MSNISLLRLPEVMLRTGKSRSTIYAEIKEGTFPKSIKIGKRAVAWPSNVVDDYINNIIKNSGGQ